jgi:hypothetical protein
MMVLLVISLSVQIEFNPSLSELGASSPDETPSSGSEFRSPELVPCNSELIPVSGVSPIPGVPGSTSSWDVPSLVTENSITGARPPGVRWRVPWFPWGVATKDAYSDVSLDSRL